MTPSADETTVLDAQVSGVGLPSPANMLTLTTPAPSGGNCADARTINACVADVLEILRARTGVDFASYRPAMLERRISSHFATSGAVSCEDYLRQLQGSPGAAFRLLESITIKVSRFYRHAPTFDQLSSGLLEELARERPGKPLRIWCAGCGAGEEAYTFAMLLDHTGVDGFVEATDLDSTALNAARVGVYPLAATVELPPTLLARYLEPVVSRGQPAYRVHDSLRARARFSLHDVTSNARPPGDARFDIVSCRNVLIYLQPAAQQAATRRLLQAAEESGVLCLGEAEWPQPVFASELTPLPRKTRMFRVRTTQPPYEADQELNRAGLHRMACA
jgi:chemotaxis methyl-accepting protein methylase